MQTTWAASLFLQRWSVSTLQSRLAGCPEPAELQQIGPPDRYGWTHQNTPCTVTCYQTRYTFLNDPAEAFLYVTSSVARRWSVICVESWIAQLLFFKHKTRFWTPHLYLFCTWHHPSQRDGVFLEACVQSWLQHSGVWCNSNQPINI